MKVMNNEFAEILKANTLKFVNVENHERVSWMEPIDKYELYTS